MFSNFKSTDDNKKTSFKSLTKKFDVKHFVLYYALSDKTVPNVGITHAMMQTHTHTHTTRDSAQNSAKTDWQTITFYFIFKNWNFFWNWLTITIAHKQQLKGLNNTECLDDLLLMSIIEVLPRRTFESGVSNTRPARCILRPANILKTDTIIEFDSIFLINNSQDTFVKIEPSLF